MIPPTGKAASTLGRGRVYKPEVRVVNMTVALAEKILEENTMNRPLRKGAVEKYASDMLAGNWKLNGETIQRTRDGDLLNGQHRRKRARGCVCSTRAWATGWTRSIRSISSGNA